MDKSAPRTLEILQGESQFVRLQESRSPDAIVYDPFATDEKNAYGEAVSLLRFVHLTDVQLSDFGSPTRFEYVNRYKHLAGIGDLVPGYRPQEFLVAAALTQFVHTINSLEPAKKTGAEVGLVVTTGDIIDNAQVNEFTWATTLLGGGTVVLGETIAQQESVHSGDWEDTSYWNPESGDSDFTKLHAFPVVPGLLDSARSRLTSPGLRVPWIAANGNHEVLTQGVGPVTERVKEIALEKRKSFDIPVNPELHSEAAFIRCPELFFDSAPARTVTPRSSRGAAGTRRSVVQAYLNAPGEPSGHGFSTHNLARDTAYYTWSASDRIVFVCLDTAQPAGGAAGTIDAKQLQWLSETLRALTSYHYEEGRRFHSGIGHNPYLILFSHHPLVTISDRGQIHAELLDTLGRYPQVIAWLSGHTHSNEIVPHHSSHFQGGFYEITTCSVMDWPSEVRVIEVMESKNQIELHCEMMTHNGTADPGDALTLGSLASWHRLLGANALSAQHRSRLSGRPMDRNVFLKLPRH